MTSAMPRRAVLRTFAGSGLAAVLPALGPAAHAADYPSKPIRLIVPYPAGGGADTIARAIGVPMSQALGVPVIVENKPGASGNIGNDTVAKAAPDGYTLLLAITALIQTPALYRQMPYNVARDFAAVSQVAKSADLFVLNPALPARSLQEFIALARSQPGKLSYGNYGNGTSSHMHGEMLKMGAGIDLAGVPYRGAAPLVNDMLGGQLSSAFIDATSINPHLKSDKLRIVAITGQQRHPALPEVPTMAEQGLAGFESNGWFAVFAPGGTPKPIVERLTAQVQAAVQSPQLRERLSAMGLTPVGSSAEVLAQVVAQDMPRWTRIAREARISLD